MGLAVSFGIIQQSGGNIVVKSAEGKGTTFQIYLPQQPVTATAAETTPAEAHSMGGTETILLVDDNPDILEISSLILRESGYHVFTATSGERARSVLQQRAATIKLVITDIIMPKQNGDELATVVQQNYPWIKLLFISGYNADTIGSYGATNPGIPCVLKPYTSDALKIATRKALDSPTL